MLDLALGAPDDDIRAEVAPIDDHGLVVRFIGVIGQAKPGLYLDPFLAEVHRRALEDKLSVVEVDVMRLSFLNSSGIKSLIKWVMRQSELPPDGRYLIRFLYSRHVTWQQMTLKAITNLSRGSVIAETLD